ncbi:cyclic-AMP phosphodiesterase [Pisolithus marmoratus]|nr:cyclic-AMP phosphodiesterase [Pisolithus marmoratus]
MPFFDVVVVGSGGGVDETNLSGYLLKPCGASWDDGIIALEAGSGHGALGHILKRNPSLFGEVTADDDPSKRITPFTVYSNVQTIQVAYCLYADRRCFLITHAHLDHISSLVLSAGTMGGGRKYIYGSPQTLKDLETIFSGRIWPNLAGYDEDDPLFRLIYRTLHADGRYKSISRDVSVRSMTVSHGESDSGGAYESSCFFVKHIPTQHEFIFFGDVEPDSTSVKPRNVNVWRAAAPKIPHNLSAIFIECSYPAGRPTETLYGHLSADHLAQEMLNLATEIVLRQKRDTTSPEVLYGALAGLRVYLTHCKETFSSDRPINHVIRDQCRDLLKPHKLGVEILTADQGMKIEKTEFSFLSIIIGHVILLRTNVYTVYDIVCQLLQL